MDRKRNTKARGKKALRQNPSKTNERRLEIALIPSYPKQKCWDVWLPSLPVKSTTIVTSGVIALSYSLSNTNLQSFNTRFASTFDEYRIVQARMRIRFFSSTNPGVLQVWFDEKVAAAPSLAQAQERYIASLSCASVDKNYQTTWTSADPLDLQYVQVGVTATPAYFKMYTDNANFGSSIVATDYFEVEGEFRVQFRGLQGV